MSPKTRLLLADNHDSFTYNIVDILRRFDFAETSVILSRELNPEAIEDFDHIIISPGPMTPCEFPILKELITYSLENKKPLLGICLGHQAIFEFFGGKLLRLINVVHGQQKRIHIDVRSQLFKKLPPEIDAGLYHSWLADSQSVPDCLKIIGSTSDFQIMAIEHLQFPIFGIQFHPESFLTPLGKQILENFTEAIR
jgi:anthranilate synthase/aminodeoxychorismate synthase-like glutamine amidotransferase